MNFKQPQGKMKYFSDGYKLVFSAASFGHVIHGAHQYEAKEIHIHVPSEHTFGDDEVRSPLELQIICQDMFGTTAAISVLFKIGKENDFLSFLGFGVDNPLFALKLRNNEAIELNSSDKKLDLGKFLNNSKHYVTYMGSLTSPPCTQNVQWFVLLQKLEVSEVQLEYFPVLFGRDSNIRGIQNLENRLLKII
jgi:carbonic anhydrase